MDEAPDVPVTGSAAADVEHVHPGRFDFAGNEIACVYAFNPPHYAVYRTGTRVMVHFADAEAEAKIQRSLLANLTPLRGQINSLIDGWHSATGLWGRVESGLRKRAMRYDRRVADALVVALENDAVTALSLLAETKNDLISERTSRARIAYLGVALGLAAGFVLIAALLGSPYAAKLFDFPGAVRAVWIAVAGGTVGAFFSIAIGLKGRTVLIDLQNRDNFADVALRMLIGAIAGGMLLSIMVSGLISSVVDKQQLMLDGPGSAQGDPGQARHVLIFVIGFIAGFFERLVPDLLSQTKLGTEENTGGITGAPNTSGTPIPPTPPPLIPPPGEAGAEGAARPPGVGSVG